MNKFGRIVLETVSPPLRWIEEKIKFAGNVVSNGSACAAFALASLASITAILVFLSALGIRIPFISDSNFGQLNGISIMSNIFIELSVLCAITWWRDYQWKALLSFPAALIMLLLIGSIDSTILFVHLFVSLGMAELAFFIYIEVLKDVFFPKKKPYLYLPLR